MTRPFNSEAWRTAKSHLYDMDQVAATVGRRPVPRRPQVNKSNMPHLPIFADELLCGEPTHGLDDVLLSGSDDEYYDSSAARSRCLEEHARLFLEGRRPRLLSASLKGPFGRETGWENPWRGRGGKIDKKGASHSTKVQRPPMASTSDASGSSRKQTAAPPTRSVSSNDLGTTPNTNSTDKGPELKKRAAGTDWLRRKNLKRLRPNYDDALTASPSASRSTRAASIAKAASAPKTPTLVRSVSEPAQDDAGDKVVEDSTETVPNQSVAGAGLSVSHISNSDRPMSVPLDLLWSSHVETGPSLQRFPALFEEATTHTEVETRPLLKDDASAALGDDTTLLSEGHDDAKEAGEPLSNEKPELTIDAEIEVDIAKPTEDVQQDVEPTEPSDGASDEQNISHFADTTSTTCATDTAADERMIVLKAADDTEMVDARLATQDQSPWAKTHTNAMIDDMITDSPAGPPVAEEKEDSHEPAALATQSPWSRETQSLLPATAPPQPDLPFTNVEANKPELGANESGRPGLSLSQNPWAEVNTAAASFSSSVPNLPTSPCSPDKEVASLPPVERQDNEQEQEHEPFLPSLPIPIVHSSGTAPSTPDTKRSSLPTPDMTVSIKSFRRFRSPTPTPPPRRRSTKAGGPRSILSQSRRRFGATTSATKSGRRVHFSLSEGEEGAPESDGVDGKAVSVEQDNAESRGRHSTRQLISEVSSRPPQRAASPPPQDKVLMESLPTEVDRFKSHFATMAGRTRGQQAAMSTASPSSMAQSIDTGVAKAQSITMSKRQDPALDLELYSSPSVDAMASRFQEVDAETSKLQQISSGQSRQSSVVSHAGDKAHGADGGDNKENATRGQETEHKDDDDDRDDDAASAVDDVQDVMDNLDDFLGLWDMDAELAEVRAGRM